MVNQHLWLDTAVTLINASTNWPSTQLLQVQEESSKGLHPQSSQHYIWKMRLGGRLGLGYNQNQFGKSRHIHLTLDKIRGLSLMKTSKRQKGLEDNKVRSNWWSLQHKCTIRWHLCLYQDRKLSLKKQRCKTKHLHKNTRRTRTTNITRALSPELTSRWRLMIIIDRLDWGLRCRWVKVCSVRSPTRSTNSCRASHLSQ